MGTNIVYLPVRPEQHNLSWIGPPFLLDTTGIQHPLIPDFSKKQTALLRKTDSHHSMIPGTKYALYVWKSMDVFEYFYWK